MKKIFSLFVLFFLSALFADNQEFFFIPPKNYKLIDPKTYSKYIKIAFCKNEKAILRPNLNLSIQETDLTLDEYTKEAQSLHQNDSNTTYTILGKIDLEQGKASLCQINQNIHSTNFQMLQMIFIKDKKAYIMTASSKKDKMLDNYQSFLDTFSSFKVIDDLFLLVSNLDKQKQLKQKFTDLIVSSKTLTNKQLQKNLISFEKYLENNFQNLGKYFQILLLQKALKETKGS